MPDLSEAAVTVWLADVRPVIGTKPTPPPVRALEKDGPIPALLVELGQAFDAAERAPEALCSALREKRLFEQARDILAQLGPARALRLISWLGELDRPDAREIANAFSRGQSPQAHAIRATLTLLTQGRALRQMFALETLTALQTAAATAFGGAA